MAAAAASTGKVWRPKPPSSPPPAVVQGAPQRANLYDQRLDAVIACGRRWLEAAQKAKEEMGGWKSSLQVTLGAIGATHDKEAVVKAHYEKYQKFERTIQALRSAAERLFNVEELCTRPLVDEMTWTMLHGIGAISDGSFLGTQKMEKALQAKIEVAEGLRGEITDAAQDLETSLKFQQGHLSNLSHTVTKGREPRTNNSLTRKHSHFGADYAKYCAAVVVEDGDEKEASWEEVRGKLLDIEKAPYFKEVTELRSLWKPTLDKSDSLVERAGALIVTMQGKLENPLEKGEIVALWQTFIEVSAHRTALFTVALPRYTALIEKLSPVPNETSMETLSQMGVTTASVEPCNERIESLEQARAELIKEKTRFTATISTLQDNVETLRSLLFHIVYLHKYGEKPWSFVLSFLNQPLELDKELQAMWQEVQPNSDDNKGDRASATSAAAAALASAAESS